MAQSTAPTPSLTEKKDENTKTTTDSVNSNSESPATTDDDKHDAKPIKGILLKPGEVPHHKDQELKMDKSTQVKDMPGTKYEDKKNRREKGLSTATKVWDAVSA